MPGKITKNVYIRPIISTSIQAHLFPPLRNDLAIFYK